MNKSMMEFSCELAAADDEDDDSPSIGA